MLLPGREVIRLLSEHRKGTPQMNILHRNIATQTHVWAHMTHENVHMHVKEDTHAEVGKKKKNSKLYLKITNTILSITNIPSIDLNGFYIFKIQKIKLQHSHYLTVHEWTKACIMSHAKGKFKRLGRYLNVLLTHYLFISMVHLCMLYVFTLQCLVTPNGIQKHSAEG